MENKVLTELKYDLYRKKKQLRMKVKCVMFLSLAQIAIYLNKKRENNQLVKYKNIS